MAKRAAFATACFAIFFCVALSGCVTRGPVLSSVKTELAATPFFPQTRHHCGPAALATVLGASGADVTLEALTPLVYIPERRGSLQVEMQAAPRGFARLALPLPRTPEAIIAELESGRPVLVLHNYGLPSWPRWHYAVVVGYDSDKDVFTLRSGTTRREQMRTRRFMVAWHYAGRWAMVVLRPGETGASADAKTYLESAADFERAAKPEDARSVFDAAVRRWPGEAVALVGRGTAEYRIGNLEAAARDYAAALALDAAQVGARNNLAQALVDLKCPHRAREQLAAVDAGSLQSPLREAVLDTRRLAEAAASTGADAAGCPTFP
jgi:tetratricopeptide (TPR) repeat protein